MLLHRLRVRRVSAQSSLRVLLQQLRLRSAFRPYLLQNVRRVGREIGRNVHRRLLDFVEQSLLVAAVKRRLRVSPAPIRSAPSPSASRTAARPDSTSPPPVRGPCGSGSPAPGIPACRRRTARRGPPGKCPPC